MMADDCGRDNTPFFLLGCVRSGTTMLRNLLRLHPRLECPEETHFYRWADPFGSPRYEKNYIIMKIFENHRRLDGITNRDFHEAQFHARDRREISEAYGRLYLEAIGNTTGRWFDKTPQNVYGLLLISHQFPKSKLVHIHRHPLNVVSSLVEGKVMAKHSVRGAVNYWIEAMIILHEYKKICSGNLYELSYESISISPEVELKKLCEFLSEDFDLIEKSDICTHREQNKYTRVLSMDDIRYVLDACAEFMSNYGYSAEPGHEAKI